MPCQLCDAQAEPWLLFLSSTFTCLLQLKSIISRFQIMTVYSIKGLQWKLQKHTHADNFACSVCSVFVAASLLPTVVQVGGEPWQCTYALRVTKTQVPRNHVVPTRNKKKEW